MRAAVVIGVDGGGTATRALVLDRTGAELAWHEGAAALVGKPGQPVDIEAIAATVEAAARAAGLKLPAAALCAGLAGVGREPDRAAVEQALRSRGLARAVRVTTDGKAGLFDAFEDGPGLLLIAGTGSVAWGRAEDGREARVGGWGLLLGDEGSAYDIALRALRAAARAADGRGPGTPILSRVTDHLGLTAPGDLIAWVAAATKAEIAGLAPLVCEIARADPTAEEIVAGAVAALAAHVETLVRALAPWRGAPRLALAGGLLLPDRPLRERLIAAVGSRWPVRDRPADPARGAARLALGMAKKPL